MNSNLNYIYLAFEKQAARSPTKIAIIDNGKSFTFKELNESANRLARYFKSQNIKKGKGIALYLDRSFKSIVSILAAWKNECFYIPINIDLPQLYVNNIISDATPKVILLEKTATFLNEHKCLIIDIDQAVAESMRFSSNNIKLSPSSENTAWILYTSGSTGKPKGVIGSHYAITNRCKWMWKAQPFYNDEVLFLNTALSVVDSPWEIWAPLAQGIPLVIYPQAFSKNPRQLAEILETHKISRLCLVPSLLSMLLIDVPKIGSGLKHLKTWVVSGEPLSIKLAKKFYKHFPDAKLFNQYGLTESCADITSYLVDPDNIIAKDGIVPIGSPIDNTYIYVLNNQMIPVANNEIGELYFGGAQISLGYWKNAALTSERYLPNPFSKTPGERIYKTGDLVSITTDGNLEFHGRSDRCIKIRGNRVELDNIEATVLSINNIKKCAAVYTNNNLLVLFCEIISNSEGTTPKTLRDKISSILPSYMIPNHIILQNDLPLTYSGKIDCIALTKLFLENYHNNPKNNKKSTSKLKDIWLDILKIDDCNLSDDFFELGGHSLSSIRLLAKIKKVFKSDIPLKEFLTNPTLKNLKNIIENNQQKIANRELLVKSLPKESYELSEWQNSLLIHEQITGKPSLYNNHVSVILKGKINVIELINALKNVYNKHTILHSKLKHEDGIPRIVIDRYARPHIEYFLLEDLPGDYLSTEVKYILEEKMKVPFDLSKAPLIRFVIVKLKENEFALLITAHHVITDGRSLHILLKEIGEEYNEKLTHTSKTSISPHSLDYFDYLSSKDINFLNENLHEKRQYWSTLLKKDLPVLKIPTLKEYKNVRSFEGSIECIILNETKALSIENLAKKLKVTPFIIYLSAFATLLHRYTMEKEILIGTPIENRNYYELEDMVGCFINTMPIYCNINGGMRFSEVAQNLKQILWDMQNASDVPLRHIVNDLSSSNLDHSTGLFQVQIQYEEAYSNSLQLFESEVKPLTLDWGSAKFDLTLIIERARKGTLLSFEYAKDLFDRIDIIKLFSYFDRIIVNILEFPNILVANIPLVPIPEIEEMVCKASVKKEDNFNAHICIHEKLTQNAKKYANNVAITYRGINYNYLELEKQSNYFANLIINECKNASLPIGVCLSRSPDLIFLMIGIWKAGCTYVPLDPNYPEERLNAMLEQSKVQIIITDQKNLLKTFKNYPNIKVVALDNSKDRYYHTFSSQPTKQSLPKKISPSQAAIILFTSGTTGRPKGIVLEHQNIVHTIEASCNLFLIDEQHTSPLLGSISFDASIYDLFLPLFVGGKVIIMDELSRIEPQYIKDWLPNVNLIHCIPSLMKLFLETSIKYSLNLKDLKTVLLGGDRVEPSLIESIKESFPWVKVYVVYGPSETSIMCSYYDTDNNYSSDRIMIGNPIPNSMLLPLDYYGNPVPISVPGELYFSGPGLARGYLNQPMLTAQNFLPWHGRYGDGRAYKTGDIGRILRDGNIEFLGRKDNQAKIRGYRVELAEVESGLKKHPKIKEAVACFIKSPDSSNDLVIASYIVAKNSNEFNEDEFREYLNKTLPSFMIPSFIINLEALPLSPNGKIDQKKLPLPTRKNTINKPDTFSNPIYFDIAVIWKDLLGHNPYGVYDNFFTSGGHSLLAVQFIFRLNETFKVNLSLAKLFELKTIQNIVSYIKENSQENFNFKKNDSKIEPYPAPLTLMQERFWFMEQFAEESPLYNIADALELKGSIDVKVLKEALTNTIKEHEILKSYYIEENGKIKLHITPELTIPLQIKNVNLKKNKINFKELMQDEVNCKFDLKTPPLFKMSLYILSDKHYILTAVFHHIIFDWASLELFWFSLAKHYNELSLGIKISIPNSKIHFGDYAKTEKEKVTSDTLNSSLEYWTRTLSDIPDLLDLRSDKPRPSKQNYKISRYQFSFDTILIKNLNNEQKKEEVSKFVYLITIFFTLLYRLTHQTKIVVGVPISGRNNPDLNNIMGCFLSIIPLCIKIDNTSSFSQLVQSVNKAFIHSLDHTNIPLEKLIKCLKLKPALNYAPLFQALFTVRNPNADLDINFGKDIYIKNINIPHGYSEFDLEVNILDKDNIVEGWIDFNPDLFDLSTIRSFIDSYIQIISEVNKDSSIKLHDINLLPTIKFNQLSNVREGLNENEIPSERSLYHQFIKQVKKYPNKIAVLDNKKGISYEKLHHKVLAIACSLQKLNIHQNSVVGIYLERNSDIVASMLAINITGATFVPLDIMLPEDRIDYIVSNCEMKVIILHKSLINNIHKIITEKNIKILVVEEIKQNIEKKPLILFNQENIAYILYTSGSTGKPKGVVISNKSLSCFITSFSKRLKLKSKDSFLAITTISFDISIVELLLPLCIGGSIVIATSETAKDPEKINQLINDNKITVIQGTPSTWHMLINFGWINFTKARLISGGEALPTDLAEKLKKVSSEVWNVYGPTEATVWTTGSKLPLDNNGITIGTPLENVSTYILDNNLMPVPIGMPGELYIGGSQVSMGYVNNPFLTAANFLPDPFKNVSKGCRMYKTGDLARMLDNGEIEFLGRVDRQIKVQGFRIEPGEIEYELRLFDSIRDCAVVPRIMNNGVILVAFIVTKENSKLPSFEMIRKKLKKKLPYYFIPPIFQTLNSLPITSNGKIDLNKLKEIKIKNEQTDIDNILPRNEIEEKLAEIWKNLLKKETIYIDQLFFELGGHSLLAIQLVSVIKKEFNTVISLRRIFEGPTIRLLANEIKSKG